MAETLDRPRVEIQVDPTLFPLDIVLLAAYSLLNRLHIRIEGNPNETIHVSLTPKGKQGSRYFQSPQELQWAFYEQLVRTSLEQHRLEQNADIRNAFLQAAFLFELPESDLLEPETEPLLEGVTYVVVTKEGNFELTVHPAGNPFRRVFFSLFAVAERVKEYGCLVFQRVDSGQIGCRISQRKGADPLLTWNRVASELEKCGIRPA